MGNILVNDIAVSPLKPQQEPPPKTKKETPNYERLRGGHASELSAVEQQKIAYVLCNVDKKEAEYLSSHLYRAISNKAIRGSPSRWLEGVIRKRRQ